MSIAQRFNRLLAAWRDWSRPRLDWRRDGQSGMTARIAKTTACPSPALDYGRTVYGMPARLCPHSDYEHWHSAAITIQALDPDGRSWAVHGPGEQESTTAASMAEAKAIAERRAQAWKRRPEPAREISPAEAEIYRQTRR